MMCESCFRREKEKILIDKGVSVCMRVFLLIKMSYWGKLAPASPEVYGDNRNLSGIKEENDLLGFQFIFF